MFEKIVCFFIGHDWFYIHDELLPFKRCRYCGKYEVIE